MHQVGFEVVSAFACDSHGDESGQTFYAVLPRHVDLERFFLAFRAFQSESPLPQKLLNIDIDGKDGST